MSVSNWILGKSVFFVFVCFFFQVNIASLLFKRSGIIKRDSDQSGKERMKDVL